MCELDIDSLFTVPFSLTLKTLSKHQEKIIDDVIDLLTESSSSLTSTVSAWRVTAGRRLVNTEDRQIDYLQGGSNPNTAGDLV